MSLPAGSPKVALSWDMWCNRHLQPLKAHWPKGAGLAMLGLFNAAVRDPAVMEASHGHVAELPLVLSSYKPLCCLVGDETVAEIVRLALEGNVYGEQPRSVAEHGDGPQDLDAPARADPDGDPISTE